MYWCRWAVFVEYEKNTTNKFFPLETYCRHSEFVNASATLQEDDDQFSCVAQNIWTVVVGSAVARLVLSAKVPYAQKCLTRIEQEHPELQPAALATDMMIYYAPAILYKENVTWMEWLAQVYALHLWIVLR